MAKQQRKQQIVKSPHGQGHLVEEILDDNLLPDAKEIERLYQMDNKILEWLKDCAEREQKFRHSAYAQKLEIAEKNEQNIRQINKMSLTFSFVIVLVGMLFSAFLIYLGHTTIGTIFAGGIILGIVLAFLKKVNSEKQN